MLTLDEIRAFVNTKLQLQRHLAANPEALHTPRAWSEGLAHSFAVDGEPWSYTRQSSGLWCSHLESGVRVAVAQDPEDRSFSAQELCDYLGALPGHSRVNPMVVDMWLVRACQGGAISTNARGRYLLNTNR